MARHDAAVTAVPAHGKRTTVIVSVAIAVVVAATAVAINRYDWHTRGRDMPKTIAMFDHMILTYVNERDRLERKLVTGDSSVWRQLDDDERRWLVDEVCRQNDFPSQLKHLVTADAWGRPFRVDVRRPASRVEFRITSAGPDGRFGTEDDYDSIDKRRYRGSRDEP